MTKALPQFDAMHAYDLGYLAAVKGIVQNTPPANTWLVRYPSDYREGYADAISDGKWGTAE